MSALALLVTATCLATPVSVNRSRVQAGPFTGVLAAGYDDVGGRFSLRVGGMRTATMSSKILWTLPGTHDLPNDTALVVRGRRLSTPTRRFSQVFPGGRNAAQPDTVFYFPSIIKPPTVGCWRLTFTAGTVRGSLTMLARPRFHG